MNKPTDSWIDHEVTTDNTYTCDGCRRDLAFVRFPPHLIEVWNPKAFTRTRLLCPECFQIESDLPK